MLTFRYPLAPAETARLFATAYGPTVMALASLDDTGRERLMEELTEHWVRHQRPGAQATEVDAEYLEVVAVRR